MPKGKYTRKPRYYPLDPTLPIDDKETLTRLGYAATTISPGAIKSVSCRCTRCGAVFDRMRRRITPDTICASCAHTKGDVPALFPHGSGYEKVMTACSVCNEPLEVRQMSLHPDVKCPRCKRRVAPRANKYIDVVETKKRFGYDAVTMSAQSFDRVVVCCASCKTLFERIRRNVVAKPICVPCSYVTRDTNPKKRCRTLWQRYGTTSITAPPTGRAEKTFGQNLEKLIGRALTPQWALPSGKSIDFYDDVSKIGVEYCGLYWHHEMSPTPRPRNYHYAKYKTCNALGVLLLTIFEDEWRRRRTAVENVLLARFTTYTQRIGARKCRLVPLTSEDAFRFLESNHLQGAPVSCWGAWGLQHNDTLVAVAVLGAHHRQRHTETAVLSRLCYARGFSVSGGTERLLVPLYEAARARKCRTLVSWSDNRWSRGDVYQRLGFTREALLAPDYSYVEIAKPRRRLSKQSQRKRVTKCPVDMTEHQWALERGLARIWDCGRQRWTLTL